MFYVCPPFDQQLSGGIAVVDNRHGEGRATCLGECEVESEGKGERVRKCTGCCGASAWVCERMDG